MNKAFTRIDKVLNTISNWIIRVIIIVFLILLVMKLDREYYKSIVREVIEEKK